MTVHWLEFDKRPRRAPGMPVPGERHAGTGATILILPCVRREMIVEAALSVPVTSDIRQGTA